MQIETIRRLPKALLHDHLDGGLRPQTVIELADAAAYTALPTTDPRELADWFDQGRSGSLEAYLAAFTHTVGVMQTTDALERVAYEAVVDLHADGVVYAETRFGPSLHTKGGLGREDAIEAVLAGLRRGAGETGMVTGVIVDALRNETDSEAVARAAAQFSGAGVVAFDLSGPEAAHPADGFQAACRIARESGLGLTIHAGEGAGPNSIWRALAVCGAQRIGHGVRIVEDIELRGGEAVRIGPLAASVRDQRIPLEVCITSNLHTGIAEDVAHHPFGTLFDAGFAVTLNTDNRLMSAVMLSDEIAAASTAFGLSLADLGCLTRRAIEAGFGDWGDRRRLLRDVIEPAYTAS
jgi:adenosine deaminase